MSKELLLSIIVPVYNTESYLKECLDSLLEQDISEYEIICINDGSTDNSLDILNDYSRMNKKIKVLSQENKGLSATRNRGIELSKGKYIYFMDSDDLLERNSLSYIISLMEKEELDLYVFDGESFIDELNKNDFELINYDKKHSYGIYNSGKLLLSDLVRDRVFSPSPCLYITRRDILISRSIFFIEGILHEDEAFTVEVFLNVEKSMHENRAFFKRRIRQDSIMTKPKTVKNFNGYYTVLKRLHNYLEIKPVRKRVAIIFNSLFDIYSSFSDQEKQEVQEQFLEILFLAKENNYYTIGTWLKHQNKLTNTVYSALVHLKKSLAKRKGV